MTTEDKRFRLNLMQSEPCFYELLDNGERVYDDYGNWITFEDGNLGASIVNILNRMVSE